MINVDEVTDIVRSVLKDEFDKVLRDAAWRVQQAHPAEKRVPAEGLNLSRHMLTGYTVTSNSPVAGQIAWSDLHIVYEGVDYGPYSGDTANTYVWFDQDGGTKIVETDTKPSLQPEDALLFINDGGTVVEVLKDQMIHGAILLDGSVDTTEIADAAIAATKILGGAVGTTALADDAVTNAKIGLGAVDTTEIATGAVEATQIGTGAVTNIKIGTGAVDTGQLATDAVDGTKMADDAVNTEHITTNAVNTAEIADGAVDSLQLATDAVTAAKIADGAVGTATISDGSIDTDKLNIFAHLLY